MSEERPNDREQDESGDAGRWERELVRKLAFSALSEQRRARRWGIFFKFLMFAYLLTLLVLWFPDRLGQGGLTQVGSHTAIVDIKGVIADDAKASAGNVVTGLRDAFGDSGTKGVILRINSPGGSPVQAGYIYDEIRRLRKEYPKIPLYAVVTDVCASGGYYIAAAADRIYVNRASIVGSIGVLMNGFGFVGAMDKLGVERRLLTAGEHKGIMDPFSPVSEFDRSHVDKLLKTIHRQFIEAVKQGRGERLKPDELIFSGLFWTGEKSIELGLADALGSSSYVAREVIGAEEMVDFTQEEDVFERLAKRIGAGAASSMARLLGIDPARQMR